MEILFYVLCVTFFLSLFILKFKWFKKIGAWLAKPFVKLMQKRHSKKKSKQEVETQKSDRLGKSEFQIRPVVLPPQLNAPKKEDSPKQTEKKEELLQDRKPMTMKEAFGDEDPFATRPVFPKAQQDYEQRKINQQTSPFGIRFAQNSPNKAYKGQDKISLDFLNTAQNSGHRANVDDVRFAQMPPRSSFANMQSRGNVFERTSKTSGYYNGENMPRNMQRLPSEIGCDKFANMNGRDYGRGATQRTPEMNAIIAKRQREYENYKKQKDNLKLDGQDVDMSGLPPKLKRILVMGVLDKKNYD